MNIYLLPRKRGKYFLFAKEFRMEERPAEEAVEESQPSKKRKLWAILKSGYNAVTEKGRRSEEILKRASDVSELIIHYPSNLSGKEAESIYNTLVEAQIKKHRRWLIVNGALLPISVLFTIIPGPNLLLAYLAWRTLAHYQTKKGGEKAVSGLKISLYAENQLYKLDILINKRFSFNRKKKINEIGEQVGIDNLQQYY